MRPQGNQAMQQRNFCFNLSTSSRKQKSAVIVLSVQGVLMEHVFVSMYPGLDLINYLVTSTPLLSNAQGINLWHIQKTTHNQVNIQKAVH